MQIESIEKMVGFAVMTTNLSLIPGKYRISAAFEDKTQVLTANVSPNHKEVKVGTVNGVLRQAGVSAEEFNSVI